MLVVLLVTYNIMYMRIISMYVQFLCAQAGAWDHGYIVIGFRTLCIYVNDMCVTNIIMYMQYMYKLTGDDTVVISCYKI